MTDNYMSEDILKLLLSLILGGIIGLERQYREKAAGFRTIIIICLGTTVFSILSSKFGWGDHSRIAAGIVTGIGFLGAGVIIRNRGQVSGLTTAATVWYSAALGMAIGAGEYSLSVSSVFLVLLILSFFPYIEKLISRFNEITNYTIKIPFNKKHISELKTLFENNNLTIIATMKSRKNDKITITWKVKGKAKNHLIVKNKLMQDKNLLKFSYS
jgi:putative Mg2+ transporter-C (MgtC) family protein